MAQARIATAEVCDSRRCVSSDLLVRGDHISFVSVEQASKVGCFKGACPTALDDRRMPADVRIPKSYVLVHDALGDVFDRCNLYVVRWRSGGQRLSNVQQKTLQVAHDYFGREADIKAGSVEIPAGPWKRVAKVMFIRYNRFGYDRGFEHEYDPPVWLHVCKRPLAWRLSLPNGCIVDSRGFVRP